MHSIQVCREETAVQDIDFADVSRSYDDIKPAIARSSHFALIFSSKKLNPPPAWLALLLVSVDRRGLYMALRLYPALSLDVQLQARQLSVRPFTATVFWLSYVICHCEKGSNLNGVAAKLGV